MTKSKKIICIVLIAILSIGVIAGIAVGSVIAVNTIPTSGTVTLKGTGAPIEGVVVSDGKNTTKTDQDGKFQLKGWAKNRFVTVTCPEGYWTDNYYFDIEGKKKETFRFELTKTEDKSEHSFLHLADTEVGADGLGSPYLSFLGGLVDSTKPDFIMHTGDICYEPGLKQHIQDLNSKTFNVPVRYAIGNHDYVDYGKYSERLYEDLYGPVWYSFDMGAVHYVVAPMLTYTDFQHKKRYSNGEFMTWLKNDLAQVEEGKKIVVFGHDLPKDEENFVLSYGGKKAKLKEEGLMAWVFGHWHQNFVNDIDGVLTVSTTSSNHGGIDSSPAAVRAVNIKGDQVENTYLHYYDFDRSAIAAGLNENWTVNLGRSLYSDPIVDGDRIYVATMSDDWPSKNYVYCIDAQSGETIWQFDAKNSVKNSMVLNDNRLYFENSEGVVFCLDTSKNTNQLVWSYDCGLRYTRYAETGLVYDNGKLYGGSNRDVFCLNAETGEKIWSKSASGEISPSRFVIAGDLLIVGKHWKGLYAYNKNTGKEVWHKSFGNVTATPFIYDGKIYLASSEQIVSITASGGTPAYPDLYVSETLQFDTASRPYVDGENGFAYIATANRGVVALDLGTMQIKWNYEVGDALICTSPYKGMGNQTVDSSITLGPDGLLYFGAGDGFVYALDTQGNLHHKYWIGSPITSKVGFYDGNLIVFDFSGNLTSIPIA